MKPIGIALFFCCAATGLAPGQQFEKTVEDSAVYRVAELVIEARRPVTTVGGAAAVEARIDSLDLPAAPTLEEVLREMPMLHVRTNSRGEAEISARGSESRQVAVLVDGVPITLAWDARADVSVFPAGAIRSVRFVRGLSTMLHGPNVLGGIVETQVGWAFDQPDETTWQASLGADEFGAYGTSVSTSVPLSGGSGEWLLRGGVGFRHSPGDPLAGGLTDSTSTDDDLRLNTDSENLAGFVALRHLASDGAWLSFSGSTFSGERGIAAELGVPDADARLWRYPHVSRTLAVLSGGTGSRSSPLGGRGDIEVSLGYDRGRTDIDAYTSRTYEDIDTYEDGKDRTLTFRLLADQTLGGRGDLRSAFTFADIRHDEIIPAGSFEYQQQLLSAGVENVWRLVRSGSKINSLALTLGAAYDAGKTPKAGGRATQDRLDEWGGRTGLSAVVAQGRIVLHGGVSRRGRFPALRELYSGAVNRFAPNPDLEPENLVSVEAGVTSRLGRGEVQVVAFRNLLSDAVVRITLPDGRFMRVNRDELKSAGLEVIGDCSLGPVDLAADATFQDVKLTDTNAEETHRPENLPERFGTASMRVPLAAGLVGGLRVEYTGSQFCIDPTTGEDTELDAETVVNGSISRTWPLRMSWGWGSFSRVETRIDVENAGDVALYDAFGLPRPGRRFRFAVRLD